MNSNERLKLKELIDANNVVDQTGKIRELKHSSLIKNDIETLFLLRKEYPRLKPTSDTFKQMAQTRCAFIFNNYTEIFIKLIKDELNVEIMFRLLSVLNEIERGTIDQHEGSYKVGALLKNIYIDSVITEDEPKKKTHRNISWKEFKKL